MLSTLRPTLGLGPDAAHLVVAHDPPVVLRGVVPRDRGEVLFQREATRSPVCIALADASKEKTRLGNFSTPINGNARGKSLKGQRLQDGA